MSNQIAEHVAVPSAYAEAAPTLQAASVTPQVSAAQISRLIEAYRHYGHRVARLDPLGLAPVAEVPELNPAFHGLDPAQAQVFDDARFFSAFSVEQLERQLKQRYCGTIGLDCSGMRSESRRAWLYAQMESASVTPPVTPEQRLSVLRRLLRAEMWERHVAATFEHAKRFSLEGCESLILLLDSLIEQAAKSGVGQIFLGMPHRGRLNTLVNIMAFEPATMLACLDPDSEHAERQRDLPYHLGGSTLKQTEYGAVAVNLAYNPSHLQSVYPVVSGMARAYNDEHPENPSIPVVIHGDAAFAGQGVVMETLNMTQKRGYALGGTLHVILNNQIGFTTPNAMDVQGNLYCTDVSRMIDAPVIRVNADDPDAVLRALKIAFDYRMEHGADVILDLIGYRRLGHSEHDVPTLTQPLRQSAIARHPTVTELYHASFDAPASLAHLRSEALRQFNGTASSASTISQASSGSRLSPGMQLEPVTLARLQTLTATITEPIVGIQLHETIRQLVGSWRSAVADVDNSVDWCFAENMAYATILQSGHSIRLSGMDVGRGTFMHRHAVWHAQDQGGGANSVYVPLKHVEAGQGQFDIVNSPLTEEAVLGFEYGYSVQTRSRLTLWEAQYGDFVNGAQVIVDQYVAPGEYKWGYRSGLTILLPHGHEGVGPEHSNAFLARFLQLCADDNLRVVMPSTSAQWFKLLRQQASEMAPKPLIVMSPKGQLYSNARSHSTLRDLLDAEFQSVLRDPDLREPEAVTRAVLCSGKFYYELEAARQASGRRDTALIRVEQLYPFPKQQVAAALAEFGQLQTVVWAQEEDENHGAWRYVRDTLGALLPSGCALSHVARTASPAGAHASLRTHQREQQRLLAAVLGQTADALG